MPPGRGVVRRRACRLALATMAVKPSIMPTANGTAPRRHGNPGSRNQCTTAAATTEVAVRPSSRRPRRGANTRSGPAHRLRNATMVARLAFTVELNNRAGKPSNATNRTRMPIDRATSTGSRKSWSGRRTKADTGERSGLSSAASVPSATALGCRRRPPRRRGRAPPRPDRREMARRSRPARGTVRSTVPVDHDHRGALVAGNRAFPATTHTPRGPARRSLTLYLQTG